MALLVVMGFTTMIYAMLQYATRQFLERELIARARIAEAQFLLEMDYKAADRTVVAQACPLQFHRRFDFASAYALIFGPDTQCWAYSEEPLHNEKTWYFFTESGRRRFQYASPVRTQPECFKCHTGEYAPAFEPGQIVAQFKVIVDVASFARATVPRPLQPFWSFAMSFSLSTLSVLTYLLNRQRKIDHSHCGYRKLAETVAYATHELKTPIASVEALAEMLLSDVTDDREREYLSGIARNCKELLLSINNILDMAKLEAGKITICREKTNVSRLLREIVAEAMPIADRRGVRIELAVTPLPEVDLDPRALRSIILNLLSNAVKHSPKGGKVDLGVSYQKEQRMIKFIVRDRGPGIPEEMMKQIFEPFCPTSGNGGSGLGLSLTRRLVTMHGGDIWVLSNEGKGASFFFTLPLGGGGVS
ncbi:MAG: ATP-binding protein [Bacillota bacterium]